MFAVFTKQSEGCSMLYDKAFLEHAPFASAVLVNVKCQRLHGSQGYADMKNGTPPEEGLNLTPKVFRL
jgi:hypothetical protein